LRRSNFSLALRVQPPPKVNSICFQSMFDLSQKKLLGMLANGVFIWTKTFQTTANRHPCTITRVCGLSCQQRGGMRPRFLQRNISSSHHLAGYFIYFLWFNGSGGIFASATWEQQMTCGIQDLYYHQSYSSENEFG
jgi:hypothetical protein